MRAGTPHINALLDAGGPFIGVEGRPSLRLTVEEGWYLQRSRGRVGTQPTNKLPIRWWQRADGTQVEREIPNVKDGDVNETLDQDAFEATFHIYNQWHPSNGELPGPPELGFPGYFCVDDATELLSDRGWLTWDQVSIGDRIWTLNQDTGRGEWETVLDVCAAPFSGELVGVQNERMSAAVTPGHRWPVTNKYRRSTRGGYGLRTTEDLAKWDEIPLRAEPTDDLDETLADDLVELIGWVITDGSYAKQYKKGEQPHGGDRVAVYQSRLAKPDNCKRIGALLERLGHPWSLREMSDGINHYRFSGPLARLVRSLAPDKKLTSDLICTLSVAQRRLLQQAMLLGDGNVGDKTTYYTSSRDEADAFQMLCALVGDGARIHQRTLRTEFPGYEYERVQWTVNVLKSSHVCAGRLSRTAVAYDGIVWCPRTKNETFLARRNNAIFYTGNTPDRGDSEDAVARWAHLPNEWHDVLVEGCVIRAYSGYGGHTKTLADAFADGNVVSEGVWYVDDVRISTDGIMTLTCRNMAGPLLIEQPLMPPLLPGKPITPLQYYRWVFDDVALDLSPIRKTTMGSGDREVPIRYVDSSVDRWYGCVDTETEALTQRGWATLDELKPDDRLLGINPETGKTEWQPLRAILRYEVEDEEMLHIKALGFDALTTLNHRWLVWKATQNAAAMKGARHWRWTLSRNLAGGDQIPRNAPYGDAPGERTYTDEFVELVGWFWTEGTVSEHGDVTIYQSRTVNAENCGSIERCLETELGPSGTMCKQVERCRVDHRHPGWNMGDYGKGVHYRLTRRFGQRLRQAAPDKVLHPDFLLALTTEQLELLFEVSMLADRKSPTVLGQSDEMRIRGFEMLCVLTGRKFSTSQSPSSGMWNSSLSAAQGRHADSILYHHKAQHRSIVRYTGTVWCPTVVHGNWLARRNGKPFITGNSNATIHGHRGTDSVDGSRDTFALGEGNSRPERPFAVNWWEYDAGGAEVNAITLHPWLGNYQMFVSIFEAGRWVDGGQGTVYYDHTPLIGHQPHVVDTGSDIPFVAQFGVPWETETTFKLPRAYRAERVRVTFRNLQHTQWGPWHYRAGIRNIKAGVSGPTEVSQSFDPLHTVITTHPVSGYWTATDAGRVFPFGDARVYPKAANSPAPTGQSMAADMEPTATALGYWLCQRDGRITAYGDAVWYGDMISIGEQPPGLAADFTEGPKAISAVLRTATGNGYWAVAMDGRVREFGDAAAVGDIAVANTQYQGIAYAVRNPVGPGFWALGVDGAIYSMGGAPNLGSSFGDLPHPADWWIRIDTNTTGTGLIAMSVLGQINMVGAGIANHGDAIVDPAGSMRAFAFGLALDHDNDGYMVLRGDGHIDRFGTVDYYGQPADGSAVQRSDGNYCMDDETEVLTKRGWLRSADLTMSDEVWSLDPKSWVARWSTVSNIFRRHVVDEPMRRLSTSHLDCLSTLDHRWIVDHRRFGRQWRTSDCLDGQSRIPIAPDAVALPLAATVSDDLVELIAWFWTEGSYGTYNWDNDHRASMSQSATTNPEGVALIDALLTRLFGEPGLLRSGHRWHRYVRKSSNVVIYRFAASVRDEILKPIVQGPHKIVDPEFLTRLTYEQLGRFIEISVMADGHVSSTSRSLPQAVAARCDVFQMAVALHGEAVGRWADGTVSIKKTRHAYPFTGADDRQFEKYTGVIWCPTTETGTWMARRNGKAYFTGNTDFVDIVRDIFLWCGFWLYDPALPASEEPVVFGNLEYSGTYSDATLGPDNFDKKPAIDAINLIKETLGYIFFVNADGGVRFESPNWWSAGNFMEEDGTHTEYIPEFDERKLLTQYDVLRSIKPARSEITIASHDPTANMKGTLVTRLIPSIAARLKGITKPAQWVSGIFTNERDQQITAELISVHLWFQSRQGQGAVMPDPRIQVNDQVRVFERQTAETYIHYLRGLQKHWDLDSGDCSMRFTSNWLGNEDHWVLASADQAASERTYVISDDLYKTMRERFAERFGSGVLGGGVINPPYTIQSRALVGDPGEGAAT